MNRFIGILCFLFLFHSMHSQEIIVIDNASQESVTKEYLDSIESSLVKVYRTEKRDPSNEYARGLNTIYEKSDGEFVMLLE